MQINTRRATALALFALWSASAQGQVLDWMTELDTTSYGVSWDGLGSVYDVGRSRDVAGTETKVLAKYDAAGALEWSQDISAEFEYPNDVSADGLGGVYVSGGEPAIVKYDSHGTLQWTRRMDEGYPEAVSADGLGSVYAAGSTVGNSQYPWNHNAHLAKYDDQGVLEWTRELDSAGEEWASDVSADPWGNVYMSGWTDGNLDGTHEPAEETNEAFLAKYDESGALEWTRQLAGSVIGLHTFVSADGLGGIYIAANTRDATDPNASWKQDVLVARYSADGAHQWTRQHGTALGADGVASISADGLGNVYIAGALRDPDEGHYEDPQGRDAFVAKYDDSGAQQWIQQFRSGEWNRARGVSADGLGGVYATLHLGDGPFLARLYEPVLLADFNGDLTVDEYDLDAWQLHFGSSESTHAMGDADGDGYVTGADLMIWQREYDSDIADAQHSVPEPATVVLLIVSCIASATVGHRRRKKE